MTKESAMCGSTTVHSRLLSNAGVLMVGLSVLASSASAQSGGSSAVINGHIQDESGGTLPGVTATLSSPALQVRQIVTVSDADGNYRFGELPVGVYTIKFELAGFTTFIRNELRLPVGFV
ncbi:MAG: hypothetical protein DMF97_05735, partial [Acidobacteria bacterium]